MITKKIKTSELKVGPIQHEVLPLGFIVRVQKFKEILREVETSSLEETISNFQRDLYPEEELLIWETIAHSYECVIKNEPELTITKKKDMFRKLLTAPLDGSDCNVKQCKV